jgi:hypothetical protein
MSEFIQTNKVPYSMLKWKLKRNENEKWKFNFDKSVILRIHISNFLELQLIFQLISKVSCGFSHYNFFSICQ